MGRVVKDPEVRRAELVEVAEQLFIEKGFEDTTVADIVKRANVAQGTFYYYFKSKEEALNVIIEDLMNDIVKLMKTVLEDENLNAVQKIIKLFTVSIEYRKTHEARDRISDVIHDEKHELAHARLEKRNTPIFEEMFESLIRQGKDEDIFNVEYPEESAMALVAIMSAMGHVEWRRESLTDEDKLRLFFAYLDLMERILGTKKGAFAEVVKVLEGSK